MRESLVLSQETGWEYSLVHIYFHQTCSKRTGELTIATRTSATFHFRLEYHEVGGDSLSIAAISVLGR